MSFYKRRRPDAGGKVRRPRQGPCPRTGNAGRAGGLLRNMLYERLCRRFTEQAAAAAVAEMVQLDYVNDDRYAEARAHSLLAARKSRRAAAQNLRQKGLSAPQVAAALEAVYAPDEDGENPELSCRRAGGQPLPPKAGHGPRAVVVAALQRRGFAYPVMKEAIKRVEEE